MSATCSEAHVNRRLYEKLRSRIFSGPLRPNIKLPSSRALAANLGVSRNTMLKALEQLTAERYRRERRRLGTYVARELPDELTRSPKDKTTP